MTLRLEQMGIIEKTEKSAQAEKSNRTERTERIKERVPVSGNRDILTVEGKEEGWVYRWVLDLGNRLEKFKRGGWEIVTHPVLVGDSRAATPSALGSAVVADSGGDRKLVLMRISELYYKEDQDSKEAAILATEEAMGKNVDGSYGKISIVRK